MRGSRSSRRERVAVRAGHPLGEAPLAVRVVLGSRSTKSSTTSPSASRSAVSTESVSRCLADLLHGQPVDHDRDVVLLLLLQLRRVGEGVHRAVDQHPRVALGLQLGEQVDELALAGAHHRGEHLEPAALGHREHLVDDLLRGLPLDHVPADRAVRDAGPGVEQPQVVVDLGDRADGRARVAVGGLLVDRDGRREALDEVDVGLVHLARGTAARRRTATRRSGAGPRRRSCRRRGWTCPEPDSPVNTMMLSRGRSRSTPRRLCSRAPRTTRRAASAERPSALRGAPAERPSSLRGAPAERPSALRRAPS